MKLQFKIQQYQNDATQAVVDVFKGQDKGLIEDIVERKKKKTVILNQEFIEEEIVSRFSNAPLKNVPLLENIQKVQQQDRLLRVSTDMKKGLNFTVEMETGTGKTYVYTKTIFELNRKYGWSKFIVIVPSIAIREGVYKSFQITADHFKIAYKKKLRYFIYDNKNSSNLSNIKNFSSSSAIEVMVMNYQAFATKSKDSRKIYEKLDATNSIKPIDIIKKTNPILIIDEPQRLGKTAEKMLSEFNPLFTLRYSATHKEDFHKLYRLDAIDAYNEKLVKRISVKAIDIQGDSATGGYLFLDSIKLSKKSNPTALIEIDMKLSSSVQKKSIRVAEGDNLFDKSNQLRAYQDGYVISEINGYENSIRLLNGIKLYAGEVSGSLSERHLRRIQIRESIRSHIQKEKELFGKGIKVLSLFFIDEVKKYRDYDEPDTKGEYAKIFEEEYAKVVADELGLFDKEYQAYVKKFEIEQIHKGYFSVDKKGKAVDPKSDREGNSNDVNAYDLIMKDKERLLSFDEPTRFIFSHSALKEGWDNPNVFVICTLKQSSSKDSKRQEIGRGLRVCVDKNGIRQDVELLGESFFDVNSLTVVASESYEDFASNLQKEMLDELSRIVKIESKTLKDITLYNEEGEALTIDKKLANTLLKDWKTKGYIGEDGFVTPKALKEIKEKNFTAPSGFEEHTKELQELLKKASISATLDKMIGNEKQEHEIELKPNNNFENPAFQALWSKINTKATYKIEVDSQKLQEASIEAINQFLEVERVKVKITTATQKEEIEAQDLANSEMMENSKNSYERVEHEIGETKYDLVGELERSTALTRKSIVTILSKITPEKFELFGVNPEAFILKVANLINQQKAKLLVDGIVYSRIGEKFKEEIFTIANFKYNLAKDTIEVEKHIYDYLKYDSDKEKRLATQMEEGQVLVYAKLPKTFKIPTPIGNYSPDWAIVFEKTDKKEVYFIAETKGDCNLLQLKGAEEAKIAYAQKCFGVLSDEAIAYDCVASYEELIDRVLG